ncbi:unnamed protein product [Eruca vesicaria subsp. sativa]|uniref:Uncharacterized protein n=2 Tax=Eruca vesicaria subsp. sativa TaxID=29727 RepID=A0ABC8IVK5_ERUVS|nr:unnamed protein product [Eruca vesicaria subsp. sativa]
MSIISYYNEEEKGKVLEDLTSNVKQIQDDLLKEILTLNSGTEYLQNFLHGSSAKELFKKNLPIVTYKDVKTYIDRVANGEPSNVISALPITNFFNSSGTSGGANKILPTNNKYLDSSASSTDLIAHVIRK